jgi:hypothetical protein
LERFRNHLRSAAEQFRKFSDPIGRVTGLVSAAIHSSVASIAAREPHHAAL